jgi:hypothetical protein
MMNMPVRKIPNRRGTRSGKFTSKRLPNLGMLPFETLLERDLLITLDFSPTLTYIESQPLKIPYDFDGRTADYIPDFHVIDNNQNYLFECKHTKYVATDRNLAKQQSAQDWCTKYGWIYRVVTDHDLRQGHRLNNITLLRRFSSYHLSANLIATLRTIGTQHAMLTVEALAKKLTSVQADPVQHIYSALWHHIIACEINAAPLNLTTALHLKGD